MMRQRLSPTFTFITRAGFTPRHSRKTLTPWSVFQDGSPVAITPASLRSANLGPRGGIAPRAITLPEEPRSQGLYPPTRTDAGLGRAECTGENIG